MDNLSSNPFSPQPERSRPRFSLTALFLIVIVNFTICTLLLLASKVPAIAEPISSLFGTRQASSEPNSRMVHFLFLVACYTAPLAVTGTLSLIYRISQSRHQQRQLDSVEESDSPFN